MLLPVKVLLIEDNRIESRQTQRWLANAKDGPFDVEWIERMRFALDRIKRGGIDIVVLDLNLPDSRGLESFLTLHKQAPHVPIVVLTGEDNTALGALAVEQGALGYLVKQKIDGAELARVLRDSLVRHRAKLEAQSNESKPCASARVVGFIGAKGGVGTTTLALNVALALAKQPKSIILAELRPSFGTLAFHLHQTPPRSLRSLLDAFPERLDENHLKSLLCKGPVESRILFGPQADDFYKDIDSEQAGAVVQGLAEMADFVILDLPSQPSVATQSAFRLCNYVAVVTEREPSSIACAKVALGQLKSWGVGGKRVGTVVVNRTEHPSAINLTEIRTQLGCEIVGVVPPGELACCQALEAGVPVVLTMADYVGASFVEIANRFSAEEMVGMRF